MLPSPTAEKQEVMLTKYKMIVKQAEEKLAANEKQTQRFSKQLKEKQEE
jgi:hypothetical protein